MKKTFLIIAAFGTFTFHASAQNGNNPQNQKCNTAADKVLQPAANAYYQQKQAGGTSEREETRGQDFIYPIYEGTRQMRGCTKSDGTQFPNSGNNNAARPKGTGRAQ